MSYVIGVDTGGTFTDVAAIDDTGHVATSKAPTTPGRLMDGVWNSLQVLAARLTLSTDELLQQTRVFRFSGTTAINGLLTRGGVKTGLLCTRGFEDTLFIGRALSAWAGLTEEQTRHAYRQQKGTPLVPKKLVRGINERVDWSGKEVVPLDMQDLEQAIHSLVQEGAQAITVCFLWSIRNPDHELRAKEAALRLYPTLYTSTSHEISTSLGEYERFTSAVINAYVGPLIAQSLSSLEELLRQHGFTGQILVAQSDGGCLYASESRPVYTLQSGPAAGVIASKLEGDLLGYKNIISTDVGGTSFDVGLVVDGNWIRSTEPVVDKFHLSFPMIEVESIGAGGGSIAWIDEGGALNIGPQSAGATPGPVAYGQGGTEPTVTDAGIVLGYLNPDYFLGGKMQLHTDLAQQAIGHLGEKLGLDPIKTAAGIFDIANAKMSALVAQRVIARGYDLRDFVLFAYGGGGAMHGAFYAAELNARQVVVPSLAGGYSALGVASAPLLHTARVNEFAAMPMSADSFNSHLRTLEADVRKRLDGDEVPEEDREIVYSVEMRYGLQMHTVRLTIPRKMYTQGDVENVSVLFDQRYEQLYGKGSGYSEAGRFLTSFVVDGYGTLKGPERAADEAKHEDASQALVGTRDAFFNGAMQKTSIYRHDLLKPGNMLNAPAIVETRETTIVIPPGHKAWLDQYLNVHIEIPSTASSTLSMSSEAALAGSMED